MRIDNLIVKPLLTEKSVAQSATGKYSFLVTMDATKDSVASQIHSLYGVDVLSVSTLIMPGKQRRILKTRRHSKSMGWKKAIVKLKEGQHIDVFPKEK